MVNGELTMWIIFDHAALEIVAMFHDRNTAESWAKKYHGTVQVYFDKLAVFYKYGLTPPNKEG